MHRLLALGAGAAGGAALAILLAAAAAGELDLLQDKDISRFGLTGVLIHPGFFIVSCDEIDV